MDEVAAKVQTLPYSEGLPVVVSVQEPGRHLAGPGGMDRILDRVVDVHPLHLDLVFTALQPAQLDPRQAENGEKLAGGGGLLAGRPC
jgi:hypothetical protein